ncbi:MAG: Clp protease ClpP [Pseudomonadales bacterium]|nr:Clp protease ClpP [Pseudomonadales bacterium]
MKIKILNNTGDVEVLLYEEIGNGFFGDGISAKRFAEELANAGEVKAITLRINSPGGDVFDGLTIYNTLAKHSAPVHAVVEGLAGSIASVILQAADTRSIAANAFVMIHEPHAIAAGTAEELRSLAGVLERTRDSILNSYVIKAGEDRRAELSAAMNDETWYTAAEALRAGLVDLIDEELQLAAFVSPEIAARHKWKHTPAAILQKDRNSGARLRVKLGQQRQRLAALTN